MLYCLLQSLPAGSLRQQRQQHMASSLAAAAQSPEPPTVHIERVELSAKLRVSGDDASDAVRRKRARKHEFESWQRVKGLGTVNIVEGELQFMQNNDCFEYVCFACYTVLCCHLALPTVATMR